VSLKYKRIHRALLFLALSTMMFVSSYPRDVAAASASPGSPTRTGTVADPPGESDYLCPPRLQLRHANLCPDQGPGGELAKLSREGVYPERPLPIGIYDRSLGDLPFSYRRVAKEGVKTYGSADDAVHDNNPIGQIDPGLVWVSVTECVQVDGGAALLIASGVFIPGGNECKGAAELPSFRGLVLRQTPAHAFGWILPTTVDVHSAPGADQPTTGVKRHRFDIIQVYGKQAAADGTIWLMIGPDAWVREHDMAVVYPDTQRPDGVQDDRWISINLFEQTLTVYDRGQMVFATMVSTGLAGWWTRPGVFQIYQKLDQTAMSGAFAADRSDYYYLQDVPWTMYFDKSRALHGAYWHNGFGYPRSHGCVNMSPADAHWLYNWAQTGTWVYVFDPSGATPTDPSKYGEGGT